MSSLFDEDHREDDKGKFHRVADSSLKEFDSRIISDNIEAKGFESNRNNSSDGRTCKSFLDKIFQILASSLKMDFDS